MQNYRQIRDAIPTSTYPLAASYDSSHTVYEPYVQPAPLSKEPVAILTSSSTEGPVYDYYGSSIISVDPSPKSLPMSTQLAIAPMQPLHHTQPAFDPAALGLPLPPDPAQGDKNWKGLYSSSGFDLLGVLARVAARPNPQIDIGSIDSGCSFLVCDAQQWDHPIVYASETFSRMTGYENREIMGQNCELIRRRCAGRNTDVHARFRSFSSNPERHCNERSSANIHRRTRCQSSSDAYFGRERKPNIYE